MAGLVGLALFFFVLESVFPKHRLRDIIPHRLQIRHDLHPELLDPFFFFVFQRWEAALVVDAPPVFRRDRNGGSREFERRRSASESVIAGTAAQIIDPGALEMTLTPPLQVREREIMETLRSLCSPPRRRRHLTA